MLIGALQKLKRQSGNKSIAAKIKESETEVTRLENNYDSETDIDMLDSYIFEILAKKSKIKYLKRLEKLNTGDNNEHI